MEGSSTSGATANAFTSDKRHTENGVNDRSKQVVPPSKPKKVLEYESDIEPEDLMPVYLETKAKLFHLQPTKQTPTRGRGPRSKVDEETSPQIEKLNRKLKKIEGDILFDQYLADKQWDNQRILLEREAAVKRSMVSGLPVERERHPAESSDESEEDEVSREAAAMALEVLQNDSDNDDGAIADLFASLPVTEVDSATGKSNTVINGSDGSKTVIRDFGKTTGVGPRRVLEEACRARYVHIRLLRNLDTNNLKRYLCQVSIHFDIFGDLFQSPLIAYQLVQIPG